MWSGTYHSPGCSARHTCLEVPIRLTPNTKLSWEHVMQAQKVRENAFSSDNVCLQGKSGSDSNTVCLNRKLNFQLKNFFVTWTETSDINYPHHSETLGWWKWSVDTTVYQPTWLSVAQLIREWINLLIYRVSPKVVILYGGRARREKRNLSRGMEELEDKCGWLHFLLNTIMEQFRERLDV